jgi:hypothetical protein
MRRNGKFGRKANFILDITFLLVFLFALAIIFILVYFIRKPLLVVSSDLAADQPVLKANIDNIKDHDNTYWDSLFLFLFLAMWIALWFSVWFIDTHPVFFIVMLIIMVVVTLLAMMFGDAFTAMFTSNDLTSTANEFIIIPFIMQNIVVVMICGGFVTGILLFAKNRRTT